jgi:hypothetical protein
MPDLPDDIGVTPATSTQPAILWERHGNTLSRHAVPDTMRADDREEPQS